MKFTAIKDHLDKAFATAERFTGKNMALPILSNLLLESQENGLVVSATNLEYGIQIEVPGTSKTQGKISIPAKLVSSLTQSIKNDKIDLEGKEGKLFIKSEGKEVKINGMPAEDFPILPKIKKNFYFSLDAGELSRGLMRVLPAVSVSEFKPELNGVCFKMSGDTIRLAATDTFRLTEKVVEVNRKNSENSMSFILPARVAQELARILVNQKGDVEVATGENQIEFTANGITVVSRLIEGNFPEYGGIIPKQFETSLFIPRQHLLDTIRASGLFASKLQDVTFKIQGDTLEIQTGNTEIGEYKNTLPCAMTGKDNTIHFNYRYLLDGLQILDEDEIFVGVNTEQNPSLFRNKSEGSFFYLLMPIRVV